MKFLEIVTPRRLLIWLFIVPSVLGAIYYAALARERFVSEFVIAVRDTSSGSTSGGSSALTALLGGANPVSPSDTLYVMAYLHSTDLLESVDAKLHVRDHFASAKLDPFYRVWPWMSKESFLDFFRNRISITIDEISGLITVDVEGFTPEFSRQLASEIMRQSEKFLNEASHQIAREKMTFAQSEVEMAWSKSQEAKAATVAFQTKNKLLDPVAQAATTNTVTSSLQANLTQQEAALKASLAYMQEDSYPIKAMRSQIAALQAQLETERVRSTAGVGADKYGALAFEYQALLAKGVFYDTGYQTAMVALEQARVDTLRKIKTLVVIQAPSLADSAVYPQRWYNFATVLAIFGMVFAIVRLAVATIREHQD